MFSRNLSGRTRCAALVATASAALVATAVPAQSVPAQSAPAQAGRAADESAAASQDGPINADVDKVKVPVATAAQEADAMRGTGEPVTAELAPTRTEDFGMVGVTWSADFDPDGVEAQIRTRTDGHWNAWQDLEVDEPSAESGPGVRNGTAPLWVGQADGVAARVSSPSGRKPAGLKVVTIDPGEGPAVTAGASLEGTAATGATVPAVYDPTDSAGTTVQTGIGTPRFVHRPTMVSRKGWGANPRYASRCDTPHAGSSLRGVIVHHTAGNNGYSRREAPGIVRGIYAYHTRARGWCDIGYNFLVDKFGTVYKGRRGSSYLAIRGAHAGNWDVNTYATGISMIGNFQHRWPWKAMRNKMVKLVGWKLATSYLGSGVYPVDHKTMPRIGGHRQVYQRGLRPATSTACPGTYGMRWVKKNGGLRDRVHHFISDYSTPIKRRRDRVGPRKVGNVHRAERRVAGGYRTVFTGTTTGYSKKGYGPSILHDAIRVRYNHMHQMQGPMGWVKTNIYRSHKYHSVWRASFENGRIYARHHHGYAIYGKIYDKYNHLGRLNSRLGYPTSSVYKITHGYRARFTGGRIDLRGGKATVYYS